MSSKEGIYVTELSFLSFYELIENLAEMSATMMQGMTVIAF